MKKKLSLLLILACILSLCTGSALADIKESEIEARVYDLIEEHTEYTRDQLRTHQMIWSTNVNCWVMSALLIDCPEDEDGIFVVNLDTEGNLLGDITVSQKIEINSQIREQMVACLRHMYCYEYLAEWSDKWLERSSEFSRSDLDHQMIGMLELGISMPAEGSIPYEDAYAQALTYLAQLEGWNENTSGLYEMSISCYHTPHDIGTPVYYFLFESIYENSSKLIEQFGEHYPVHVSIMVNAQDGSLIEAPIEDCVPAQFTFLEFLLRTDEILEVVQNNAS